MTHQLDSTLLTELISLITALEDLRKPWEATWDRVLEYCYPTRRFYAPEDSGKSKEPKINFSTRARKALATASGGFQEYTANRRTPWMQLQFEDQNLNKQYMVADWLESCQRAVLGHYNRTGFYGAIGEVVPDGHTVGTGIMYSEEDPGRKMILYRARHPKAIWLAENAYGEVDTVIDDNWLSRKAAIQRFGKDNLHESVVRDAEKNPMDGIVIKHIVMPMDKRYLVAASGPRSTKMPFLSLWYDPVNRWLIDAGGYWEMPYTPWRYEKNDGEVYGRSPAMDALGDVLASNQMTRSRIALGNLIAEPPMVVDKDLKGQDYIIPGYHIYRQNERQTVEPVNLGANYPITKDNEEMTNASIDEHFNVPLYKMLSDAERQMTAREVIERMGEKAAIIGHNVGMYEAQVLQPNVRRTFNILYRAGQLPPPPPAVLEAVKDGVTLKVEFLGRLSQMQKQYFASGGINNAIGYVQAIGTMNQDSLDNVDFDALMREGLESAGAPASVVREEDDVKKIRISRVQQQQALMQQQEATATADRLAQNADKLAKRPEPGSPAEQIQEQA